MPTTQKDRLALRAESGFFTDIPLDSLDIDKCDLIYYAVHLEERLLAAYETANLIEDLAEDMSERLPGEGPPIQIEPQGLTITDLRSNREELIKKITHGARIDDRLDAIEKRLDLMEDLSTILRLNTRIV